MPNETETRTSGLSKRVQAVYEWLEALGTAIIIAMLIFTFLLRVNEVKGSSMLPTYTEGTRVIVQAIGYQPSAGDVVVIDATHTPLQEFVIKRIIATEGQTVDLDDSGAVLVDGVPLDESSYLDYPQTYSYDLSFPQTVPEGCVFVLGDNREFSTDSRSSDLGMIDARYVIGKVLFSFGGN